MAELKNTIEDSFIQYSGAVIQSRALVDVRDGLKPSARQILYCMDMCKYTSDKPFQATAAVVGDAMKYFYIHGDASCLGVVMRAGQPFAMRYPLVEVGGNGGTLISSGNWAAARYTKSRLSKLGDKLFESIQKETITEWRDNFSDTEQYPSVLPTKGFYNIVNGTQGISIGMASSIPQFNLREVNNALIHLLDNPTCSFEEIYCAPDFATGAVLYNEDEVKDALKNGTGFACKLRSVVEYDSGERCFVVKEIPYSVYTNTICGELEAICNDEANPGIERFNDLTGEKPLIKIYIAKKANPDKVLNYLYKNTSLQYYYGINMTMLDHGRVPRVFTWKEALQAHLDHEREVYINGYKFDLRKIEARLHTLEGLLKAINMIDEVIKTIKQSSDTKTAAVALQRLLDIDEIQAKAILDIKLARLAHLEIAKLQQEQSDLLIEKARIENILSHNDLLNEEIKKGLREVAAKFGDDRRTKVINLSSTITDEPVEIRSLQVSLTNHGNLFAAEASTLYTQKRGGVGNKFKLANGEYVISTINLQSNDEILLFTQIGNVYHCAADHLEIDTKIGVAAIVPMKDYETVAAITAASKTNAAPYIFFVTRNGLIKKSALADYNTNRSIGLKGIALDEGDEIVSVLFGNDGKIGIASEQGNFIIFDTTPIRAIGRVARGIIAIKLNNGDNVAAAHFISETTKYLASISGNGLFKQTSIIEYPPQTRGTKGKRIQRLNDGDWIADFLPIIDPSDILIAATKSCIKLTTQDIPVSGRDTLGQKSIKMAATDNVVCICLN